MYNEDLKYKTKRMVDERNAVVKKMFRNGKHVNGVELQPDTAFGINSTPINHQLHICGHDQIVFITGNTIVIKNLSDKTQTFINKQNRFRYVTAIETLLLDHSKNKSIQIFLGESSLNDQQPTYVQIFNKISIYKTLDNELKLINTQKKGIVKQIYVHGERKEICVLINSSQILNIVIHNYDKNRLIGACTLKTSVQKLSLHPNKQKKKQIYVMSHNFFRIWQINLQQHIIKQSHQNKISLSVQKQHKFNDHVWTTINKTHTLLLVALHLQSQTNKIILLQNDVIVQKINIEVSLNTMMNFKIQKEEKKQDEYALSTIQFTAIAITKKGFVLGGSNKFLAFYEFQKNFAVVNTQTIHPNKTVLQQQKITKIYVSINDQILTFNTLTQSSLNFYFVNMYQLDTQSSTIENFFHAGFHTKKVHNISRSITKNLIASCSQDNTVKIWNFYESQNNMKRGILSTLFSEEPISVSMHPSGLFVAVGFITGFKIFCIVSDELVLLKQTQLPNCRIVKYANGGHYLIVNEKQHIFVYDSIYYQTIHVLQFNQLFSLTSNVQEICVSDDDLYIVATCHSGYVFCFSLLETTKTPYQSKKAYDHQEPSIYNSIAYDSKIPLEQQKKEQDQTLFIGGTIEKFLTIWKNKCRSLVVEFPVVDVHVTSLLVSSKLGVVFVGTSSGTIRVYLWPLNQSSLQWQQVGNSQVHFKHPQFYKINIHAGPVTTLCLSHDCNYLFSGCEDGTIMCMRVRQKNIDQQKKQKSGMKDEDKERIAQTANDLYLEKVSKIQQKNQTIQKLKNQVIRSEQKLKMQKQKLELMFKQKLENLKKQFNLNLQTDRKMKQSYIETSEKDYQQGLAKLQAAKVNYQKEIEKVKEDHQKKILYQQKRNQKLGQQIQQLKDDHKNNLERLREQHKNQLKQNKRQFFEKCQKLQIKYSNVIDVSKRNAKQFIHKLDQKDHQYEAQIEKQIKEKKEQIQKIQMVNQELKQKNSKLQFQYNDLKKRDQELQNQFEEKFQEHNKIRFQNLKNDQDILKMQHQLLQRLQVIDSKQQTCKNARYEQTTLQNFRFMLDQKIESLQEKKKQMMQKIQTKQNDLKNMFAELIKESQENQKKYRQLKILMSQIDVLQADIKKSQNQIVVNTNRLNNFQNQLSNIVKSDDDTKTIARKLHDLLDDKPKQDQGKKQIKQQKKIQGKGIVEQHSQQQVNEQLQRQGKWMQKKIQLIKVTSDRFKQLRQNNINETINQNVKLIQQCNDLRNQNQTIKKGIADLQKKLNQQIRKKQRGEGKKKEQNLNQLDKKVKQQQSKINMQQTKLASMNVIISNQQQIQDVLNRQKKLPTIKKQGKQQQQKDNSRLLKDL